MEMKWYRRLCELADELHSKNCDSKCFTEGDILNLAVLRLTGVKFARQDGSSVQTLFGDFGNVSYDHLVDYFYKALEKLKEEAENTPL